MCKKYLQLIIGFIAIYALFALILPAALQILQPIEYQEKLAEEDYEVGALFYSESEYALERFYTNLKEGSGK